MSRTRQYMQHGLLGVFFALAVALCAGGRVLTPLSQERIALALNIAAVVTFVTLATTTSRYRPFVWHIAGATAAALAYLVWNVPQGQTPWLEGAILFLAFSICMATYLVQHYGKEILRFGLGGLGLVTVLFAALLATNVLYLVVPWQSIPNPPMTVPARAVYYVYRAIFAADVAFAMVLAMRTRRASELMLLQGLTLLHASAFGWSHVLASADTDIRKWTWQVWSVSMLLMLGGLVRAGTERISHRSPLAPWISVRFLLTAAIFFSNMGLLFGMRGLQVLAFEHGARVGAVLVVCFASWAAADWLALYVSNRLDGVSQSMPGVESLRGEGSSLRLPPLAPAQSLLPLAELDAWVHSYNKIIGRVNALSQELIQQERQLCLTTIAAQVSHDIRSPLAALQMLLPDMQFESKERESLARGAVHRIRTIADTLLKQHRSNVASDNEGYLTAAVDLASLTRSAVAAKRVETSYDIVARVDAGAESARARFAPGDLERCLSNLLNNAVEASAFPEQEVVAHLHVNGDNAMIDVVDQGKGIPADLISKLGTRGLTVGKANGNGLGLFHARETMRRLGGDLELSSQLGKGTRVRLVVPLA